MKVREVIKMVTESIYEAIEMHIQGLIGDRLSIPEPHSSTEYIVESTLKADSIAKIRHDH